MEITIKKLTPALVESFFEFFNKIAFADHPEWGCDCYCCFFHAENKEDWEKRTGEQNAAIARERILQDDMNGCLAFIDGQPVGWCHFDDKANFPGLGLFYPQTVSQGEAESIGAIVCFTVAQGFRGRGVAKGMLTYACAQLKERGFSVAEAYPSREASSSEEHYHGPLGMYLAEGFSLYKEADGQTIVRKALE